MTQMSGTQRIPATREKTARWVPVEYPRTFTALFLLESARFFGWGTRGGAAHYLVDLGLIAICLITDRAHSKRGVAAGYRRLLVAYTAWLSSLSVFAVASGTFEPDVLVLLAEPLPFVVGAFATRASLLRNRERFEVNVVHIAAAAYCALAILDARSTPDGSPVGLLSHEHFFVGIFALTLPKNRGVLWVRVLAVLALGMSFVAYPAASALLQGAVAVIVAVLIRRPNRLTRNTLSFLGLAVAFYLGNAIRTWLPEFYRYFDRADNTTTRIYLWSVGVKIVEEHPIAGSAMTSPITSSFRQGGDTVVIPLHNSYLAVAVAGGLVALLLFLLLLLLPVVAGLLTHGPVASRQRPLLPALAAAIVSMSVNPVIDRLETGLFVFALSFALSAGRSMGQNETAPAEPTELVLDP
jgi:hypothetical protein